MKVFKSIKGFCSPFLPWTPVPKTQVRLPSFPWAILLALLNSVLVSHTDFQRRGLCYNFKTSGAWVMRHTCDSSSRECDFLFWPLRHLSCTYSQNAHVHMQRYMYLSTYRHDMHIPTYRHTCIQTFKILSDCFTITNYSSKLRNADSSFLVGSMIYSLEMDN